MAAEVIGKKPLFTAIDELYHQKVKVLPEEETAEEEEQNTQIINRLLYGSILGHSRCCPDRDGLSVY